MKLTDLRGILQYIPQFREKIFILAIDASIVIDDSLATLLLDVALLLRSLEREVRGLDPGLDVGQLGGALLGGFEVGGERGEARVGRGEVVLLCGEGGGERGVLVAQSGEAVFLRGALLPGLIELNARFLRAGLEGRELLVELGGLGPESGDGGFGRPVMLYWGGRRPRDLYHDAMCREWTATIPGFTYVPVVSEALPEDGWSGRTGFVHLAAMADVPDMSGLQVYACGTPAMVDASRRDFIAVCGLPVDV